VSIRDQILPIAAGQTLFDVLRTIGVDAVELLVDFNQFVPYVRGEEAIAYSVRDAESTRQLRRRFETERMRISALLVNTDFCADDAPAHVKWATRVVQAAGELEVPVVRIDPLTVKRSFASSQVRENLISSLRQILDQTAGSRVDLGLENHGPLANDEQFLDEVLNALAGPRVGLTLDTGNFYWWGYPLADVYRLIEKYAARAKHTHVKNVNYPPALAREKRPIGHEYKQYCSTLIDGNLDLRRVAQILCDAGYRRDLCVEDESLFKFPQAERVQVLRRDVAALRAAMTPQ